MPRTITFDTRLDALRKEAKRWLKACRANDADALARWRRAVPQGPSTPGLRDIQHAIALEYGLSGWGALKARLAPDAPLRRYQAVAEALIVAYRLDDARAIRIVHEYFGHQRPPEGLRRYVRLDLGGPEQPGAGWETITLDQARSLVARGQGFVTWEALVEDAASMGGDDVPARAVEIYDLVGVDGREGVISVRTWTDALTALAARTAPGLRAPWQMTDAVLDRTSRVAHLAALEIEGSKAVTPVGLQALSRMRSLRRLNLSQCAVDDRSMASLEGLTRLETLGLEWTRVTDEGARSLAGLKALKTVNLMGTPSGDEAIRALAGAQDLSDFRSGAHVTDAGLAHLHDLPVFATWRGGEARMSLTAYDAGPNYLLLRGGLTDRGLKTLAGLDGLFALNLDCSRMALTGAGVEALAALPRLGWLAFEARDESMPAIAALPHLRFLMCQDTTASDAGFKALSRSGTIRYIWARRCENLRARGFAALADMPALEALSASCRNAGDAGLSALPRFPALRELMPIDAPDEGYRHIGRCEGLESLVMMYCRDTTDVAARHIIGLPRLKRYFASYTRMTDETPRLLASMDTLEEVTLDGCAALTDQGVAALTRLPRLRRLSVSGMPGVTAGIAAVFDPRVEVRWSP